MNILKSNELKKYYSKQSNIVKALDGVNVEIAQLCDRIIRIENGKIIPVFIYQFITKLEI